MFSFVLSLWPQDLFVSVDATPLLVEALKSQLHPPEELEATLQSAETVARLCHLIAQVSAESGVSSFERLGCFPRSLSPLPTE